MPIIKKGEKMQVTITTAEHMSDETYSLICEGFRKQLGDVTFEHVIDNAILGGFIADADGMIYDASMLSQLEKIKQEITE